MSGVSNYTPLTQCPASFGLYPASPLYPELDASLEESSSVQSYPSMTKRNGILKIEIEFLGISQRVEPDFIQQVQQKGLEDEDIIKFAKQYTQFSPKHLFAKSFKRYFEEVIQKHPDLTGRDLRYKMLLFYHQDLNFQTFKKDRAKALEFGIHMQKKGDFTNQCPAGESRLSKLMNSLSDCWERGKDFTGKTAKRFVMFLTATKDHAGNGKTAYGLSRVATPPPDTISKGEYNLFNSVAKFSSFCHRFISTVPELAKRIEEFAQTAKKYEKPSTLIINAHGQPHALQLGNFPNLLTTGLLFHEDAMPRTFRKIPEDSTLVLLACSTGNGGSTTRNIANTISNLCSPKMKLVAPEKPTNFVHYNEKTGNWFLADHVGPNIYNITYTIPGIRGIKNNRSIYCPKDRISYLSACNSNNINLFEFSYNGKKANFYNENNQSWDEVTNPDLVFKTLEEYRISNRHLILVSRAGIRLDIFAKELSEYSPSENPDQITREILQHLTEAN